MAGMKYRKLRIAWSVGWGMFAVLLIVAWIRSYWFVDSIYLAKSHSVTAVQGLLFFDVGIYHKAKVPPIHHFGPVDVMSIWNYCGVGLLGIDEGRFVQIWLVTPFVIALAVIPWVKRFSLRTVLIALTLSALLLGLGRWNATFYQRGFPSQNRHGG
jgi:hypothetical protein